MADSERGQKATMLFRNFVLIITLGLVSLFVGLMLWGQHAGLDYAHHITWALEIEFNKNFSLGTSHFLYNLIVAFLAKFVPLFRGSQEVDAGVNASIFLLTLVTVGIAYILWREVYKRSPDISPVVVMGLVMATLLITPANILLYNSEDPNLFYTYFHPTPYHNPTFILTRPFALLLTLYAAYLLRDGVLSWRTNFMIVASLILGTLTKPNFTMAFMPAMIVLAIWYQYRQQTIRWKTIIFSVIVPAILILAWQFFYTYLYDVQPLFSGSITIKPFAAFQFYAELGGLNGMGAVALNFLVTILFPLALALLYPEIRRNRLFILSWLTFAIAVAQAILFTETGRRAGHGNFLWGGYLAIFVLYAVSVLTAVEVKIYEKRNWRFWLIAIIFVLHLISGMMWFYYSWRVPGIAHLFW